MIELHDSNLEDRYGMKQAKAKLDEDLRRGFKTAVNNNQTRLALEYAVRVIADLDEKIDVLLKEKTSTRRSAKTIPKEEVEE